MRGRLYIDIRISFVLPNPLPPPFYLKCCKHNTSTVCLCLSLRICTSVYYSRYCLCLLWYTLCLLRYSLNACQSNRSRCKLNSKLPTRRHLNQSKCDKQIEPDQPVTKSCTFFVLIQNETTYTL